MGRPERTTRSWPGVSENMRGERAPVIRRRIRRPALALGWLALLVLLLTSCGVTHIRALREAENTFNDAAAADNRERLDETFAISDTSEIANSQRLASRSAIGEIGRAATGYRLAAKMADELISKKSKELLADDLLCTAYVIKAMSLWRLGEFEPAMAAANAGGNCSAATPTGSTTPRETALLKAVAGLARVDDAYALLTDQNASPEQYKKIRIEIEEALSILQSAAAQVSAEHPVRAYLLISRMAAIRVWQTAIDKDKLTGQTRLSELKDANDRAQQTWGEYRQFLECQLRRKNDPSVKRWADLFGISVPAGPVTCP